MLSVRELARDLELELLAGDDAADAPVRWVHISELADPTPWLSGGELLLTTGMGLGDAASQRAYVDRLAEHGLAGLGFGLGFGHDAVPEPLLEAARARGFPFFCVPYELPFIAVTERAFTQLVNEQYAVLRRAIAGLERLQRIVLSERGLDVIAGTLSTLIGEAALVFDGRGEPLARRTPRRGGAPARGAPLPARAGAGGAHRHHRRAARARAQRRRPRLRAASPRRRRPRARAARRRRPRGAPPAAAGVAGRDQGHRRAERLRPPPAPPGGHGRRARAAARARRRHHRAPPRGRPALRDRRGHARRARAGAAPGAVRP